jgi:hypothetical protein
LPVNQWGELFQRLLVSGSPGFEQLGDFVVQRQSHPPPLCQFWNCGAGTFSKYYSRPNPGGIVETNRYYTPSKGLTADSRSVRRSTLRLLRLMVILSGVTSHFLEILNRLLRF